MIIMIIISIFWFMSASIGFHRSYLAVQFSSKVVLPIENKTYRFCLFTFFAHRLAVRNWPDEKRGREKKINRRFDARSQSCLCVRKGRLRSGQKQMRFHHRNLRNLLCFSLSWELGSKGLWIARPPRVCSSVQTRDIRNIRHSTRVSGQQQAKRTVKTNSWGRERST